MHIFQSTYGNWSLKFYSVLRRDVTPVLCSQIGNQRSRFKPKMLVFLYYTTVFNQEIVSVEDFQLQTTSYTDLELAYGLFEILREYNACPCTVVYPHPRQIRSWCNRECWHDLRLHMYASNKLCIITYFLSSRTAGLLSR